MGLSAWEQQILDSIKSGIAKSDPELAALMSAFARLAPGEEMPDRGKVPGGSRRALWRVRHDLYDVYLAELRQEGFLP